jgi:hypothetical protein
MHFVDGRDWQGFPEEVTTLPPLRDRSLDIRSSGFLKGMMCFWKDGQWGEGDQSYTAPPPCSLPLTASFISSIIQFVSKHLLSTYDVPGKETGIWPFFPTDRSCQPSGCVFSEAASGCPESNSPSWVWGRARLGEEMLPQCLQDPPRPLRFMVL